LKIKKNPRMQVTAAKSIPEDASAALRSRELEVACEAGGADVPFVLRSFGSYDEKASGFISTLRSALLPTFDPFRDPNADDPVAQLLRDIAAATHLGNAAAVMEERADAANLIWVGPD